MITVNLSVEEYAVLSDTTLMGSLYTDVSTDSGRVHEVTVETSFNLQNGKTWTRDASTSTRSVTALFVPTDYHKFPIRFSIAKQGSYAGVTAEITGQGVINQSLGQVSGSFQFEMSNSEMAKIPGIQIENGKYASSIRINNQELVNGVEVDVPPGNYTAQVTQTSFPKSVLQFSSPENSQTHYLRELNIDGNNLTEASQPQVLPTGNITVQRIYNTFQSSSIQGKGATLEENQYIKGLVYNNQDLLAGQNWTIPYGAAVDPQAVIETIEPATVYGQVVPEGKYVKSFTWSGVGLFPATGDSPPLWTIPAGSVIEPTVVLDDLPIPTTVTFDNTKLDSSKPYTNVYAVVTHSDGTTDTLTNGYTFQDGDVISLAGTVYETPAPTFQAPKITAPSFAQDKAVTALMVNGEPYQTAGQQITLPEASLVTFTEKQIPPATVSLPVLPPEMVVTDYSLAGATQGQTAEIQAGSSQTLATQITPFEVTVNLDYTNTTVPVVQPLTTKGGDPDAQ